MSTNIDTDEFEDPNDEEEKKTKARRMFTYSAHALQAAEQVERLYFLFVEFKTGLDICDRLYQLGRRMQTPHGALITGAPGTSKTSLARYFMQSLPSSELFEAGMGALYIRLKTNPSQGHIISSLLRALKYPFTEVRKNRIYAMSDILTEAISQKGTKIIFVDQAHCLATQQRIKRSEVVETPASDTLRELMEATKVSMVLMADDTFSGLEHIDKALADRISVRHNMTHFASDAQWHGFLKSFADGVKAVDLKALLNPDIAAQTFVATQGNRRSFRRLITEVVLVSIQAKCAVAAPEHFKTAYDRVAGTSGQRGNPYVH